MAEQGASSDNKMESEEVVVNMEPGPQGEPVVEPKGGVAIEALKAGDEKAHCQSSGAENEEVEEEVEGEEGEEEEEKTQAKKKSKSSCKSKSCEKKCMELKAQIMQDPEILAALQDRLDNLVGQRSGYIESLPKVVKRRIKALKNYQVSHTKLEAKFYEEVHQLECKYAKLYEGLYEKRRDVVIGTVEPTDSDCEWQSSDEEEEEEKVDALANELKEKAKLEAEKEKEEESPNGIPEFWLTIFKNVDIIEEMVQEHDEPILKHLEDITVKFHEGTKMGFTLEFHFTPNEFFSNSILTKDYQMRSEPDENDPFSFEGPEIIKSEGCTIEWQKGKNVTVKTVKKKQKHKGRGTTRMVTKTVQNDSFFNFFSPPKVPEEGVEIDEETEQLLSLDFEIGHFIRERVVPRAVLYFTGEAIEDDEYEEEGEEEDNEGEEGDEEDENDPDYKPDGDKPQECKQQ